MLFTFNGYLGEVCHVSIVTSVLVTSAFFLSSDAVSSFVTISEMFVYQLALIDIPVVRGPLSPAVNSCIALVSVQPPPTLQSHLFLLLISRTSAVFLIGSYV